MIVFSMKDTEYMTGRFLKQKKQKKESPLMREVALEKEA